MKKLSHLIADSTGVLQSLRQHAHLVQRLQQLLSVSLPEPINQHCYIANLHETTMVIYVDSSLWATQLRYLAPEIIESWQRNKVLLALPVIDQIEVKVRPPFDE